MFLGRLQSPTDDAVKRPTPATPGPLLGCDREDGKSWKLNIQYATEKHEDSQTFRYQTYQAECLKIETTHKLWHAISQRRAVRLQAGSPQLVHLLAGGRMGRPNEGEMAMNMKYEDSQTLRYQLYQAECKKKESTTNY